MGSRPTVASKGEFCRRRPERSEKTWRNDIVACSAKATGANVHSGDPLVLLLPIGYRLLKIPPPSYL